MNRLNIAILGVGEVHWTGNGFLNSGDHTMYFSGNSKTRQNGVRFVLYKKISKCVEGYQTISDRVITIRIKVKTNNITLYKSTHQLPTPKKMRLNNSMQKFRAQSRKHHEQMLSIFWEISMPTMEKKQKQTLLQRWKSSVQAVKTYLEADCGSDHEHLVAKIKIRFCNVKRPPACQKFVTNKIGLSYVAEIRSRFELLAIEAEDIWENVKEIVVETAEKHVLYKKPTRSAKWISEETYAIAEERRRAKVTRSRDEVRRLNAMFQQAARKDKEKYWNEECAREEEAYRKRNMRELYQHVKKARAASMARQATFRGRNGEEPHDLEGIRKRWKEYTEQLYAGNNRDEQAEEKPLELEPDILEDEVVWAMKQLAKTEKPQILMAYH
ncbi:uncharacterized protein LOC115214861 [Octopus sinensis]|nr:uncharacterized protein LOC115214861 [Octopus sinensis]